MYILYNCTLQSTCYNTAIEPLLGPSTELSIKPN